MAIQRQRLSIDPDRRTPIPAPSLARRPAVRQTPPPLPRDPRSHAYAFLLEGLVDYEVLVDAEAEARDCGAAIDAVLIARGCVTEADYAFALARCLDVSVAPAGADVRLMDGHHPARATGIGLAARIDGWPCRLLSATAARPRDIERQVAALRAEGHEPVLTPQPLIDALIEQAWRPLHIERAVNALLRTQPRNSAAGPGATWQSLAGVVLAGLAIGGAAVHPDITVAVLAAIAALPFLCVTALRLVALAHAFAGPRRRIYAAARPDRRRPGRTLPFYSVLVPLYREANVLPALVRSLQGLDYPAAKLEIFLILEADDLATQAAAHDLDLPPVFRILIVPAGGPRTKPKALNYALQLARGDFVVVYDAEDRPHPGQLRSAWEAFRRGPAGLACVQARLNIYNAGQSWLTRQFTIEYSALFDAILPALARLRLPVPLGGTSNHFPRSLLLRIGAWDPYNVTEDADLGIRIARLGYRTAVLDSTTWEEAPPRLGTWLKQRTRWLKGWMQTYLVHTRAPAQLNRDLGPAAALGFHVLMGGMIASALVHPLFYVLLAYHWLEGSLFAPIESTAGLVLWTIAGVNLGVGYAVSILVGMVSVLRRRRPGLALHALLMPLYWLLISAAAYRALYQRVRDPYLWEKTQHGTASRPRARGKARGSPTVRAAAPGRRGWAESGGAIDK